MRLLICETWRYPWYGEILLRRFKELGVEALAFKEGEYFGAGAGEQAGLLQRLQRRFRFGPALRRLNSDLVNQASEAQCDAVLFVRGDMVLPETVKTLKDRGMTILGCNNDNPFSHSAPPHVWRHLIDALKYYDCYFAYRESNIPQYLRHGCKRAVLWRSFYIKELHRPLADVSTSPYLCDVSFTGHWEDDGRENCVLALLETPDIRFRLFGGGLWSRARNYARIRAALGEIRPVLGDEYNLVLNSSKIALVFLSKLNNDTYTRRCFEIPAAGTFMLSEFTDDLNSMFKAGVEAEYFRSKDEMLDKIRYYLRNEDARKKIAAAGRARLLKDGHEAIDRAKQVLDCLQQDFAQR